MRIEVSGKQFVFPRECACCGGFPETTLTISGTERNRNSRTRGWAWDVPYCKDCRRHVVAVDRILLGGLTIVALFGFCSLPIALLQDARLVALSLFLIGVFSTGLLSWVLVMRVKARANSTCDTIVRAVTYLGSAGPVHSFDFRSRHYAKAFVRANRLKLVNASMMVSQIVRDLPVSENQVARRLTKRLR